MVLKRFQKVKVASLGIAAMGTILLLILLLMAFNLGNEYLVQPNKLNEPKIARVSKISQASSTAFKELSLTYSNARKYIDVNDGIFFGTIAIFAFGGWIYIRNRYRFHKYLRLLKNKRVTKEGLKKEAWFNDEMLPHITVIVPARNEGLVIGNTLRQLARLDYPKDRYSVIVVVDERERDDDISVLTIDVVTEVSAELSDKYGADMVQCLEVPKWYSGSYCSNKRTHAQSSKGRALNWALQKINSQADMIGVLDADGRLDQDSLLNVGYQRMMDGSQVLQGPVLQVSNINNVSLVGVAAGMELALHHLTELPTHLLRGKKVQFLAGTNYFIEKDLIIDVGGWNQNALVEDAELALRIYAKNRVLSEWLNVPEFEQTPPSIKVYTRQRERWARGHLQLLKQIRNSNLTMREELDFYQKIIISQLRVFIDMGVPIMAWTLMLMGYFADASLVQKGLMWVFALLAILMLDTYGYVYRSIISIVDERMTSRKLLGMSFKLLIFSPMMIFIQARPRIQALINHYIKRADSQWYKTERTQEVSATT